MNVLWQMPAIVVAILSWLSAPPSGLAEVAQREAFRRSATQRAGASLSNLGLPNEGVPNSAVSMPPAAASGGDAASGTTGDPDAKPKDDAATAAEKAAAEKKDAPRDEKWWRTKMDELRAQLDKDQFSADSLQARINALQADSVNLDDPIKQTRARMDLVRSLDELDKTKKQIEADRAAISALQGEARRLSVPAGWIR